MLLQFFFYNLHAFGKRFYMKRFVLHLRYILYQFLSYFIHAFPGNWTHDLGISSAMLCFLSYRNDKLWYINPKVSHPGLINFFEKHTFQKPMVYCAAFCILLYWWAPAQTFTSVENSISVFMIHHSPFIYSRCQSSLFLTGFLMPSAFVSTHIIR